MGYVNYMGKEYRGQHQALVSPALFAAVQAVRESQRTGGEKARVHRHYLKSCIFCMHCERRLIFTQAKGRYDYFVCVKRARYHVWPCDYLPAPLIEEAIERSYDGLALTKTQRDELRAAVTDQLSREMDFVEAEIGRQTTVLRRLEAEQEQLMQAYYSASLTPALMGREQGRIEFEQDLAQQLLDEARSEQAQTARRQARITDLVTGFDLAASYQAGNTMVRRYLNQALFEMVAVGNKPGYPYRKGIRNRHNIMVKTSPLAKPRIDRLTQAVFALADGKSHPY